MVIIEGLAVPLDKINKNDWGIPSSEADNVIQSLKSSRLNICKGEAHACDFSGDPYGRIGKNIDAWLGAGGIYAKYEVTDSVAARKLKEGSWHDLKWSTFLDSDIDPKQNKGWAGGVKVNAMTLVKNPAWDQVQYQIAASEEGVTKLRLFSDFTLITSQKPEGETIPEEIKEDKTQIKDIESKLDAANKLIDELKPKAELVPGLETQITELKASNENITKELGEKTKLVASMEKETIGMLTLKEVEEVAKNMAASMIAAEKEEERKITLTASIISLRDELKIKADNDKLKTLSASDLQEKLNDLESFKLSASGPGMGKNPIYPSENPSPNQTACIGAYDAKTGEWSK